MADEKAIDYAGNTKKAKEGKEKEKPEKKIEKVVTGEVIVQKKSLGRKAKDLFVMVDFKSVMAYIFMDVLVPEVKNVMVDATTKGIRRMLYGESTMRRRGYEYGVGPRVTYTSPINRGYSSRPVPLQSAVADSIRRTESAKQDRENFILSSRDEAEEVLEMMNNIIERYDVATVSDLNELVGYPTNHVDNNWGWLSLGTAQVRQVREGYLLELPDAEYIS